MIFKVHQIKLCNLLCLMVSLVACQQTGQEPTKTSVKFDENTKSIRVPKDSTILIRAKGLVFYQDKPFTGTTTTRHPNNKRATSSDYVAGIRHGYYKKWFDDGGLGYESTYVDGKQDGATKSWWRNGNIRSESNFINGIAEGVQMQWYKSGAKFKRINLKDGREEGIQQSWRENGKIYNNYEAKNGRIFGLKRANLCFELEDEIVQFKDK